MKDNPSKENNRLLLVDDDPNLILLVKDYLEFHGYQVETAENGRDALEILANFTPNMIICDIMMPIMDGYEFIQKVRQDSRLNWIPVMFLSAKGQSQDRVKGLNMGADLYMVKPFEPEELVAQVESSLRQVSRFPISPRLASEESPRFHVPAHVELTTTEMKVVQLVSQGLSNREIAEKLKVSQRTIESHVSNMLNKTGLHNRTELARWAMESRKA
ncbi:MAG: response regulator transcription factor [Merismopediaceae bacterium]|nr:response regulator transcription factor [Merismopediaceae bacterium]